MEKEFQSEEERLAAIQQKQAELREVFGQRVSDFKHSFESGSGKKVYDYLSKFCFENETTFDTNSQSTCNFNEGSRYVILEIKKWLKNETVDLAVKESMKKFNLMKGTRL